jgi:hypothetical protein
MKFKSAVLFSLLALGASNAVPDAFSATTVAVTVTPNPATYGAAVTLKATMTPPPSSGVVAFYDGVAVVGVAPVSAGTATLVTHQLLSGARKIVARYAGVASPVVTATVNALPASGFNPSGSYPVGPPVIPGQTYAAEQSPEAIAVGDFNGDGKLDAVLPVFASATNSDSQLVLLFGNGNGTFQSPIPITAGTNIYSVAVGDFNGDGKLDLAVGDAGSPDSNPVVAPSINILLGNGNGTFLPPAVYPLSVAGFTPYYLVVGDFNLDSKEDVAVANASGTMSVSILLGNGNGTLGAPANYATGTQIGAFGLAIGDYNGDGIPDLAVSEDVVAILLGNGNGTFNLDPITSMVGTFPSDIQTGDFNNDGKADLAVASATDNQISVLLGNGNGTFQPETAYNVGDPNTPGSSPDSITVADFNGDGKQDLAVANSYSLSGDSPPIGSVSVLLGNGNGTFQTASNYGTGPTPVALAQGDFTGLGTVDLATADFGDGSGVYTGNMGVLLSAGCVTVTTNGAANYNSDATSFIITVNTSNNTCSWTATTNAPWIFLSTTGGTGYGQIAVSIVQNTTGVDRTGTISVGGQTLNITQDFTVGVFTDVTPANYYFDAVNLLSTKGITAGCGPSLFCPTEVITRDQMAIFIVRAVYGSDNFTISQTQHFADVNPSTFGYMWIQKMYELGISAGCGGGNYCPTAQVTRDDMAIFIIRARYAANTAFTYSTTPVFTDVPANNFAFKWIQRMAEDGITGGCGPALYCPSSPVTRGDMSIFIMRGGFNQLLPVGAPVISSVSPNTLAPGTSATFTVNGVNVSFVQAVTTVVSAYGFDPLDGITASGLTVTGPEQFTVTLTASPLAPLQPYPIYVQTGSVEAVLPNAVVVQNPQ